MIIKHNTRHEDKHDVTAPRRKDAVAGRIGGGEEFGILYSCNLEGAVKACDRLRTTIQQQTGVTVSKWAHQTRIYTPVDQTHEIN